MSNVIHKTTLRYLTSQSWPEYNNGEWINNPILPNCERKYWRIVSGQVKEMTTTQKNAVDAAEAAYAKEVQKDGLVKTKSRDIAIEALIADGVLNSDGTLKE